MSKIKYPPGCKEIHVEISSEELCRRLKQIHKVMQDIDQKASEKYREMCLYLGSDVLVSHEHEDVQLMVACCLAEVFRIYAPESPYQDPTNLKKIFTLFVNTIKGLKGVENTSLQRLYTIFLTKLECVNTFLFCLELEESQDIIANLFEACFKVINDKTDVRIKGLLFDILHPLLNESDQISTRILDTLFPRIIEPQKSNNKDAYNLAVNLIRKGNQSFEFFVQNHLHNIILTNSRGGGIGGGGHMLGIGNTSSSSLNNLNYSSGGSDESLLVDKTSNTASAAASSSSQQFISDKMCLIIYELAHIRVALLDLVMPQIEYKLKSGDVKERREYTKLMSKMFSEKDSRLFAQQYAQLWEAYLERFADANEDIRRICIQHIADFLLQQAEAVKTLAANAANLTLSNSITSNSTTILSGNGGTSGNSTLILEQIMEQIKNRSLDSEENLRIEVVQEILKAFKQEPQLVTSPLLNILKDRTLDVKIKVRKLASHGLAAIYKKIHSKNSTRQQVQMANWIPSKIMRMYFQDSAEDKLLVERLLNSSIVPYNVDTREKMAQLYYAFTTFDQYSLMALIEIMKNRVLINKSMRGIIDQIEASKKTSDANSEARLQMDILVVSQHLMEGAKGQEFMKTFVDLLKTNHNLRNYFKNFTNVSCTSAKSMQLIQLMFSNLQSLNQAQTALAKRLIERMSSLIIDKESFETLIELVEYKVKQKLTPRQRKLIVMQKKKSGGTKAKTGRKGGRRGRGKDDGDSTDEDDDNENDDEEDNDDDENEENEENSDELSLMDEDDEDDAVTKTTESGGGERNDKHLLKHIDDDGDKGIQLLTLILSVHANYGFANAANYKSLMAFVNSSKENIVRSSLKLLAAHFAFDVVKSSGSGDSDLKELKKVNETYLNKLKTLCKSGKPKQAKYAVQLIFNCFEKPKNELILVDLYKELVSELEAKNEKNFVTCLVSLGHICLLVPKLVGKEIKEFLLRAIVKDILMQPMNQPLSVSPQSSDSSSSIASKKRNNLKLAGKWCENEDELPFATRARIESIKLISRWCIGLNTECSSIVSTLKMLVKLIRENMTENDANETGESEDKDAIVVSEAERSRIRAICVSQLIRLAQEPAFKSFITAEYFHLMGKLMIDPVTNIRDIVIKKLAKGLKSNRLPLNYMAFFALVGLDSSRDRKSRVKKLYSQLIRTYRMMDAKDVAKQEHKNRILPEMCLSYAVSLLAHNIKIDNIKDEHKVKQIKECMSVILDPLLDQPDAYQVALIKKILDKIKTHDDGLSASALSNSSAANNADNSSAPNKQALKNLTLFNRSICFICEIFLFHLHSKVNSSTATNAAMKELPFDVRLPQGFFAAREANGNGKESAVAVEVAEHFAANSAPAAVTADSSSSSAASREDETMDDGGEEEKDQSTTRRGRKKSGETSSVAVSKTSSSRIEIRKRKSDQVEKETEKKNSSVVANSQIEEDDEESVAVSANNSKTRGKKSVNTSASSHGSASNSKKPSKSPPAKRNRLAEANKDDDEDEEEESEAEETVEVKPKGRRGRPKSTEKKEEEEEQEEEEEEEEKENEEETKKQASTSDERRSSRRGAKAAETKKTPAKEPKEAKEPEKKSLRQTY